MPRQRFLAGALGETDAGEGKYAEAESAFRLSQRLGDTSAETENQLAIVLKHEGKFSEAANEARKAITAAPQSREYKETLNGILVLLKTK